jgi:prefoldin subunit 5|tara:strand:- start:104 stop:298 length:195 start_codon:yes stop_codon:yes gene_type:complete
LKKQNIRGPADLEERIEYLTNQNDFLKNKLRELTEKYNQMEHEFEKIWEENNNLRIVRNEGKVL